MEKAETYVPPVLMAKHDGGLRFTADIRGHTIATDQPERGGGSDSAPMPLELLGASLGTCITLYVHQFLAARSLPTDGLRVDVVSTSEKNPKRIGRFNVRVHLPEGIPEQYMEMIERVAVSCPAHATLTHAPEIAVSVE
jgi:uncharacterized OsmC-like protein